MTSPAFGIAYSFWLRLRWLLSGIVILMLVLAATSQLIPDSAPFCCGASIFIVFMSAAFFLNAFSYGPADLGVKSSGFPTHMQTLPLSTPALVGWPMLFAATTFAILWAIPACLILMPSGFGTPILWPAIMLAAVCVWIQAIGWTPFPSPFARVPMLLVAVAPLMIPLALGLTFLEGASLSALIVVCSLIWSLAAYVFGVQGLARARAGSEGDWFRPITQRWSARARRRYAVRNHARPFRSAFTAQLWHECRRNAVMMPLFVGFVGLPMLAMLTLPVLDPQANRTMMFGSTAVSPAMIGLSLWVVGPLFLAVTQGPGMAKFDIWGKAAMPAFFATRPMTTAQFILIKLCSTAISVIAVWFITFGLFAVWAAVEASPLNSHPSLVRAALAEATPRMIAIFIFVLIGLVAMTWRNLVSGMWPTLLGRKHLSTGIGFGFMAAYGLAAGAGSWVYQHPGYHALFFTLLPWIIAALIAWKAVVALVVYSALWKSGLITPETLRLLAFGWLVLAACLLGGLMLVLSPAWKLVAIVVFALPFPSFAAMPLALDWNRHR